MDPQFERMFNRAVIVRLEELRNPGQLGRAQALNMDVIRTHYRLPLFDAVDRFQADVNAEARRQFEAMQQQEAAREPPPPQRADSDMSTYTHVGGKYTHNGKHYKIRTGSRGGKYILVGANRRKVYI